jgi:hypothetical protein
VYPWFEIYPGHVSTGENRVATSRVTFSVLAYPQFDICKPTIFFLLFLSSHVLKIPQYIRTLIYIVQFPPRRKISGFPCQPYYPHNTRRSTCVSSGITHLIPRQMTASVDPPVYPYIEIFPPVLNAHGDLVNERVPASTHVPFRRVRKTHGELHEEVFGADAPANEPAEQAIIQARGRIRSKSINAHPAVPQAASLPLSSLPPIPSLPMSQRLPLRMPTHNAEARHSDFSIHPSGARTSSYVTSSPHSSPIRNGESVVRSNSYTTTNSSPRGDHGFSKQNHRPRDSLILEKARYFEHLHALCKVTMF